MVNMAKKISFFSSKKITLVLFLFLSINLFAQLPSNMSNIKSADVTDAQLQEFVQKAAGSGLSEAQIIQELAKRGMPAAEINALKLRIGAMASTGGSAPNTGGMAQSSGSKSTEAVSSQPAAVTSIFGSELFANPSLSFEPDLRIPTPKNYVIGPDDKLMLDVYGVNLSQQTLTVSSEGSVNIKYAGPVQLSGLTIEEATKIITSKLAKFYPAISSGGSKVQLVLTGIRSIKIIVIGAVKKPGTYNLTSLATLFNALYVSGGPTDNGSFRNIELIRNNKQIVKADLYDFLINNSQKSNVRLMDNDVIKIPYVKTRISLTGEINRSGLFEIQPNETLKDALGFAGGYRSNAYKARITGTRNTDFEREMIDLPKSAIETFIPKDGDVYTIGSLIDKYQNRVTIEGTVFKPGTYAIEKGLTIAGLLQKAEGLKEDAYTGRATIIRTREDLTKEYITISLLEDAGKNYLLQKEDVVSIASIFDIKEKFTVTINGAVRKPGSYGFEDSLSLKSLILLAGGFTDNATGNGIEISRRKRDVDVNNPESPIVEIIKIDDTKDLSKLSADIKLKPFDVVTVKVDPYYKSQINVSISGEILNPGSYTLSSRSEKISDFIKRAGNILYTANIAGAKLVRRNYGSADLEVVQKIAVSSAKDSSGVIIDQQTKPYREVSIALTKIINSPGSKEDILLEEGDQIIIPAIDNMVSVSGEVFKPLSISFDNSKKLRDYLFDAGGVTQSGNKKRVFVVYPNGKAAKTKYVLLFFRKYPEISAGCKIFVPKVPEQKAADYSKVGIIIAGFSAIVTTMALVYQITK